MVAYLLLLPAATFAQDGTNSTEGQGDPWQATARNYVRYTIGLPIEALAEGALSQMSNGRLATTSDGQSNEYANARAARSEANAALQRGEEELYRMILALLAAQGDTLAQSDLCEIWSKYFAHAEELGLEPKLEQLAEASSIVYCELARAGGGIVTRLWKDYESAQLQKFPVRKRLNAYVLSEAYKKFIEHAENGFPVAQYAVGMAFLEGVKSVYDLPVIAVNHTLAIRYLKRSSEGGNISASYALGKHYLNRDAGESDIGEAKKYLQIASQGGHAAARRTLERLTCTETGPRTYAGRILMEGNEILTRARAAGGRCAELAHAWRREYNRLVELYDSQQMSLSNADPGWCEIAGSIKKSTNAWTVQSRNCAR